MKSRSDWVWAMVTAVFLIVDLYLIFVWAPIELTMGIVQRIFYFHVPSFWVAVVAVGVGTFAGIRFLLGRDLRFDELAVASNEIGHFHVRAFGDRHVLGEAGVGHLVDLGRTAHLGFCPVADVRGLPDPAAGD
jgi:hypothetical protein